MNPDTKGATGQTLTPPANTETTFSHNVPSAAPEVEQFVFDPVHEAENLRAIIQ